MTDSVPNGLILYLSGPMTGYQDLNFPAFERAEEMLTQAGYRVCSPHKVMLEKEPEDPQVKWQEYLKADLKGMLCCDAVAVLDGWEDSRGARVEVNLAWTLGMMVKPVSYWMGGDSTGEEPIGVGEFVDGPAPRGGYGEGNVRV